MTALLKWQIGTPAGRIFNIRLIAGDLHNTGINKQCVPRVTFVKQDKFIKNSNSEYNKNRKYNEEEYGLVP